MSLFTQKSVDFDFYTAELIFFYIDDYTVFKKQGFCFFPEYNLIDYEYRENDYSTVNLSVKNDFIDLFVDEKLSIKVLCGMNGCGKSTLLELMGGTKNTDIIVKKFYLLKDKNGNFASSVKSKIILNEKTIILDNENYQFDFYPSGICVNHKNLNIPDFDFRKNIVKFYSKTPDLYDGVVDGNLFTHFSVELWNFDNEIELLTSGSRKKLFKNENYFDLKLWLKTDILSYILLHNFQDSTFDEAAGIFEKQMKEYNVDLSTFLNDFIYTNYVPKIVDEINVMLRKIISKSFLLSDISRVEKLLSVLEEKILKFFEVFSSAFRKSQFIVTRLNDLIYFRGYSKGKGVSRFLYELSDGEWRSLKYRYEIFHSMCQHDGIWWYIDEPETYLHPEWCRNFINDYLRAYRGVKEFLISINKYNKENPFNPDKRFTIVFATHSPFLLSDLTNDYIIYLEKKDGITKEIQADKESFAGNIGEMYNENFFMKNTIGEFARQKLLKIIDKIDSKKSISEEEIKQWKLLISKIGDDLLKNLLYDKVLTYEKNRT